MRRAATRLDPKYKPDWDTPGGMAEANEPPHETVRRELREELGLDVRVGALLCVDWVAPHGPWDDLLAFVFDGGVLTDEQVAGLQLHDDELAAFAFCAEQEAQERLRPYVWRRIAAALDALRTGRAVDPYLPRTLTGGLRGAGFTVAAPRVLPLLNAGRPPLRRTMPCPPRTALV